MPTWICFQPEGEMMDGAACILSLVKHRKYMEFRLFKIENYIGLGCLCNACNNY